MKRIIITGCSGFIGSQLSNEMIKKYKVIGIDDLSSGKKSRNPSSKNFSFIKGRCEDKKILNKIKGKIHFIYHLAGQSSGEKSFYDPLIDLKQNLETTVNLLEFAIKKNCKRFIFTSSMSVYGNSKKIKVKEKDPCNPESFYGLSKQASENYIKKFKVKGLNYTIFRVFNVFGKNQEFNNFYQGMIRIYLSNIILNGRLVVKGSLNRYRDFIDIETVTNILKKTPNIKNTKNQIINLGSGKSTYIRDLIKIFKKNIKKPFKVYRQNSTPLDQFGICSDNKKLKRIFKMEKINNPKTNIENFVKSLNI